MKNLVIWILLILILIFSFAVRVVPKWSQVFQPSMVVFSEVDPWYHMRLVDYMAANFPNPLNIDQYATLGGAKVGYYPVMAWVIIGIEKLINIDYNIIGAFLPPVAACVCLLLIFLISKALFKSNWVGLGSVLIASILPSQFLQRSILGNTDHHILEALFLFLTTFFIIKFSNKFEILYSILAGLSLSLYFMNWWGSLMVLLPLSLWIILISINNYLKGSLNLKLHINLILLLITTFIPIYLIKESLTDQSIYLYSFLSLLALTVLLMIASFIKRKAIYITLLILISILGFSIFYYLGFIDKILVFSSFALGNLVSTIGEAAPMDLYSYFNIYNIAALFIFPGLYIYTKNRYNSFFLILTLFLFTISVFQIRWSYYLIISVAILCSYFLYWLSQQVEKNFKAPIYTVALLMLLIPSIKSNYKMITSPPLLDPSWGQALVWLNINTPLPFTSKTAYIESSPGEPKYTVLSWWDYGHWIIRIGQRVPLTSPTIQQFKESLDSQILTSQTLEETKRLLKGLKVRYIIIDEAMVTGKFYAIVLRQPGMVATNIAPLYENSLVNKLYKNKVEGFTLIYDNGLVKILEVDNYEKVSLGL